MAISRMNMERQLRNMGGIMTLDEPRQGYFLGKIVKKAKRAVKKVIKSPLGKAALLGAVGFGIPGTSFGGLFGRASLGGAAKGIFGNVGGIGKLLGSGGKLETLGNLFRVGGEAGEAISVPRVLAGLGIGSAIAAPFFMGEEEPEEPEESFTGPISSIESIRQQARDYYKDPTNSALYFMPQQRFVRPFAGGGLADIPREGYEDGEMVMKDYSEDPNYKGWLKLYEKNPEAAMMNENAQEYLRFYNSKAEGGIMDIPRQGYRFGEMVEKLSMLTPAGAGMAAGRKIAESIKDDENMEMAGMGSVMRLFTNERTGFDKAAFEDMLIQYEDSGAKKRGIKLMDFAIDFLGISSMKEGGRVPMQEGGIMDLGGMEKDYRTGGFVPIGAEERADDVPARLSKNEFVFTADAVRNAGGGNIDKGAEVMQNMMDNLEAGGMISEESQGKENPAQAMFDQAQMLENRIV